MQISANLVLSLTPTIKWAKPDKKVWSSMRRRLSGGKGLCVEIGWFRGNIHIGKSGVVLPTAQIAKWNEEGHMTGGKYGVHIVPPRPFIRVGFVHSIESSKETRDSFVGLTQQVADGNMTWEQAYNRLGAILLQRLQKAIKMDIYVSNTPLTISLKGHGVTLIDTGQMLNSIEYRVGRRRG